MLSCLPTLPLTVVQRSHMLGLLSVQSQNILFVLIGFLDLAICLLPQVHLVRKGQGCDTIDIPC